MKVSDIVTQLSGYLPSGSVLVIACKWHQYIYAVYCYQPDDYISMEMITSISHKPEITTQIVIDGEVYLCELIHLPKFLEKIILGNIPLPFDIKFNELINPPTITTLQVIYTNIIEESIYNNARDFLDFLKSLLKPPKFKSIDRWLYFCLDCCNLERVLKMMPISDNITMAADGTLIENEVKYLIVTGSQYATGEKIGTSFNNTEAGKLIPYLDKLKELIKISKRKKYITSELYGEGNRMFRIISKSLQL